MYLQRRQGWKMTLERKGTISWRGWFGNTLWAESNSLVTIKPSPFTSTSTSNSNHSKSISTKSHFLQMVFGYFTSSKNTHMLFSNPIINIYTALFRNFKKINLSWSDKTGVYLIIATAAAHVNTLPCKKNYSPKQPLFTFYTD